MGDGRAAESSATVDGGQAAISLRPDTDVVHTHIFESSQLEGLYVGDLLYPGSQFRIAGLEASEGPWLWLPTGLLLA